MAESDEDVVLRHVPRLESGGAQLTVSSRYGEVASTLLSMAFYSMKSPFFRKLSSALTVS